MARNGCGDSQENSTRADVLAHGAHFADRPFLLKLGRCGVTQAVTAMLPPFQLNATSFLHRYGHNALWLQVTLVRLSGFQL